MSVILRTTLTVTEKADRRVLDIAERWVAATRLEPGVVGFHAFFDEQAGRLLFLEHYRDSEAFMVHRGLVDAGLRADLYSLATFESLDVYGAVAEDMREVLTQAKANFFKPVASR